MADEESPLIKALPPASDYLTYLTIVEYNLTPENLPILHKVLQDEKLTTNIGWDLVHLLVPHLPDSEQCLRDIARLGNPREVILKVTESLRLIEYDEPEEDEPDAVSGASISRSHADSSTYPLKTAATAEGNARPGSSQAVELPPPLPLPVNQFEALLLMLSILHPRVKTKYPSRFLSTTLQAILASFSKATTNREEMIKAIVGTIRSIRGIQRPTPPSRRSSGMLSSFPAASGTTAADPEGTSNVESSAEEIAVQTKLLQSFVSHIVEEYMLNLLSYDDVPGMAWSSRIMEKTRPERTFPSTNSFADRFASEERLHRRIDAVGQLVALAQDLKITSENLLQATTTIESAPTHDTDEDDPPTSAESIPLSRLGSLLLYAAREASTKLYPRHEQPHSTFSTFTLFPTHQELFTHCLASPAMGTGALGTEPPALIDAVLSLGLLALEHNAIGAPGSDEEFTEYLQVTALLSANCPNANLRGHAHYLTSTVLRSQPDAEVRLAFIRDTLEHCPFENLKVSAVGWIKGEIVEANPPSHSHSHGHDGHEHHEDEEETSIFTTPAALTSLSPYLFPPLHNALQTPPREEAWQTLQANISFYLSSLNFLFLLLSAKHLHEKLDVQDLWVSAEIGAKFLAPLKAVARGEEFESEVGEGGPEVQVEMELLGTTVGRVEGVAGRLGWV